ncbi:MAG: nucleotide pyrophosphohydrolase [Patescibacteria group bacterium]|jgi:NTP pyrophosphatase (non-canonical NTP hydrolase)
MNNDQNTKLIELKDFIDQFRQVRDWQKFHNPKDLAEAISVEASELMELFLWGDKQEFTDKVNNDPEFKTKVSDELADVLIYCIEFSLTTGIDLSTAIMEKMTKNAIKYPVEKGKREVG